MNKLLGMILPNGYATAFFPHFARRNIGILGSNLPPLYLYLHFLIAPSVPESLGFLSFVFTSLFAISIVSLVLAIYPLWVWVGLSTPNHVSLLAWDVFYSSPKRRYTTKFFQFGLPSVLFLIQLYFQGFTTSSTSHIFAVGLISFTLSYNAYFTTSLLMQKAIFERGQAIHRVTSDLSIVHNLDSTNPESDPLSPFVSAFDADTHPFFFTGNFSIQKVPIGEFNGNVFVDNGAQLLLFILKRNQDIQALTNIPMLHWLKEECDVRVAESRDWGAKKNIVYTPEGARRSSFLKVKYAVFVLDEEPKSEQEQSSTKKPHIIDIQKASAIPDVGVFIDQWLSQYGCLRVAPIARGDREQFDEWTTTTLPESLCPGMLRAKGKPDPYPMSPNAIIWNPTADNKFIRESFYHQYDAQGAYKAVSKTTGEVSTWEEPADMMDFIQWLDSCPDCGNFHRFEIEKRRVRPSDMRVGFRNYLTWGVLSLVSYISGFNSSQRKEAPLQSDYKRPIGEGWEQLKRRYIVWLRDPFFAKRRGSLQEDILKGIYKKLTDIFGGGLIELGIISLGWVSAIVFVILSGGGFESLLIGMGIGVTIGSIAQDLCYWGIPFIKGGRKPLDGHYDSIGKTTEEVVEAEKDRPIIQSHSEEPALPTTHGGHHEMIDNSGDHEEHMQGKKYMLGEKYHYHVDNSHHGTGIKMGGPETDLKQKPKPTENNANDPTVENSSPETDTDLIGMGGVKNKNPYSPIEDVTDLVRQKYSPFITFPCSETEIAPALAATYGTAAQQASQGVTEQFMVNPGIRFQKRARVEYWNIWKDEFVLNSFIRKKDGVSSEQEDLPESWIMSSLLWIKDHGTYLSLPYQLRIGFDPNTSESEDAQERLLQFFSSLTTGAPISISALESLIQNNLKLTFTAPIINILKQIKLIVPIDYPAQQRSKMLQTIATARSELKSQGWTILRKLLHDSSMPHITHFYRQLWNHFGAHTSADTLNMQKFNWNDEPLARYLNIELTTFVEEIVRERLVSAGLALSLWIMKGEGFPLHTDSSPPFDLTMDLVVGHEGREKRPVTLCRRGAGGKVEEMTVSKLEVGDAVLFRGSECCHYGGDLEERGSFHNVVLWTWQYVRD